MAIKSYPSYLRSPGSKAPSGEASSFQAAVRFDLSQRISEAEQEDLDQIYLYMPLSARNPTSVQWENKDMKVAGGIMGDLLSGRGMDSIKQKASAVANADFLDVARTAFGDAGQSEVGLITNPHVKLLFRGAGFRVFEFQFKFAPKSPQDSTDINDIITRFRQAAAPGWGEGGVYLTYPQQLAITYIYSQNGGRYERIPWMNRFRNCVITSLDVDYTSAGHYVPMRDGFPSETTLTMQFTELDIIHRGMIGTGEDQGY